MHGWERTTWQKSSKLFWPNTIRCEAKLRTAVRLLGHAWGGHGQRRVLDHEIRLAYTSCIFDRSIIFKFDQIYIKLKERIIVFIITSYVFISKLFRDMQLLILFSINFIQLTYDWLDFWNARYVFVLGGESTPQICRAQCRVLPQFGSKTHK